MARFDVIAMVSGGAGWRFSHPTDAMGGRVPVSQPPVLTNSSQLPTPPARTSISASSLCATAGKLEKPDSTVDLASARCPHVTLRR